MRLGEFDVSTESDGPHQDIRIDHVVRHEKFDKFHMINDVAILHLVRDVEFTGNSFYSVLSDKNLV